MKTVLVKLLVSRSGNDGAFVAGDEILVPENEVGPMLDAGQIDPKFGAARAQKIDAPAAKAKAKAKVQTATAPVATETAAV